MGWKTGIIKGETQQYTKEMIQEMIDTLKRNRIRQPITFPIRAAFVSNSLDNLDMLMKAVSN